MSKSELLTIDSRTGTRRQAGKGIWSAMQPTWVARHLVQIVSADDRDKQSANAVGRTGNTDAPG